MNIKKLGNYLIATSLIISFNISAKDIDNKLEMVVISDSLGAKDILNGNYEKAVGKFEKTSNIRRYKSSTFEVAMGACVAEYGVSKLEQAEKSCTRAITAYDGKRGKEYLYFKSFALSNRSIVRYKMGDFENSLEDIKLAVKTDDNETVAKNFRLLFPSEVTTETTAMVEK